MMGMMMMGDEMAEVKLETPGWRKGDDMVKRGGGGSMPAASPSFMARLEAARPRNITQEHHLDPLADDHRPQKDRHPQSRPSGGGGGGGREDTMMDGLSRREMDKWRVWEQIKIFQDETESEKEAVVSSGIHRRSRRRIT